MQSRRDFMKILGVSLGSAVLAQACGSDSKFSDPTIPNGYVYYRLVTSGDELPGTGGATLARIPGSVMINHVNEIYFYGVDSTGATGVYELKVDYSGLRPFVWQKRKVVREGDVLKDGAIVAAINSVDISYSGNFTAVVEIVADATVNHADHAEGGNLSRLYREIDDCSLEPVAGFLGKLPGMGGAFGATMGDVAMHGDSDISVVAHYSPEDAAISHQGVFYLHQGTVSDRGNLLASTADLIPGAEGSFTGFGLIDVNDKGDFAVQGYGGDAENVSTLKSALKSGAPVTAVTVSMIIAGNVKNPAAKVVVGASPALKLSARALKSAVMPAGEMVYGPRMGAAGLVSSIVHLNEGSTALLRNGSMLASTGGVTPTGNAILGVATPVVGQSGLLFHMAGTKNGNELIVNNGDSSRTILTTGDIIEDGFILADFQFGFMPKQSDHRERIVLSADLYDKNENSSHALIVGIPL